MLETREFLFHAQLTGDIVEAWVEAGWLRPRRLGHGAAFSEIDLARAQLIRDLQRDFGVNDEGIAIILDLVDQLHGLRQTLRDLCEAVGSQPNDLQRRILAEIESRRSVSLKESESG
jgi:chaperone modulatory protein CbpM